MNIKDILNEFKTEIRKIDGSKLKNVILYGSWARGEATNDSDIDLLIILEGKVKTGKEIDRIIDIITDLNLKYNILISVYPASENEYLSVKSPLFLNVHREGIPA